MCSVIEIKNSDEYYIHYHSPESLEPGSMAGKPPETGKVGKGEDKIPEEGVATPKRFLEDGASSEDGTSGHQSDKDSSPSDKRPEKEEGNGEADPRLLLSKQEVTSDRCSSLEGEDESNSSQCKSKDHEDLDDDLIRASSGTTASGSSAIHLPEVPITVNSHIPATPDRPQLVTAASAVPAATPKAAETSDSSTQVSSLTTATSKSTSKNPFLDEDEDEDGSPYKEQPESVQLKKVRPIEDDLGVNNNEKLMRLEGSDSKKAEKERKKERDKAEKAAKKAAAESRKAAAESRKREEERAKAEAKRKKEEEKRAKEEEKRAREEERIAKEKARDEERRAREEEKQRAREEAKKAAEEAKRAAEKLKLEQDALKKQQKQRLEQEAAALRKASKIPVTKPKQIESPIKEKQGEKEKPSRIPKARNSTVKAEKKPSFLRKIRSGGSGEYKKRSKSADNINIAAEVASDSELAGDTASECCSTRPSGVATRSEADLGSLTDTETAVSSRRLPEVTKKTKKKRWITIGGSGSSSANNGKHSIPWGK